MKEFDIVEFNKTVNELMDEICGVKPIIRGIFPDAVYFDECIESPMFGLYCVCKNPILISNHAGGDTFKVCKSCKKERV